MLPARFLLPSPRYSGSSTSITCGRRAHVASAFSIVGEKVLRLEQRLGYTHKGIEQRFTQLAPLEAQIVIAALPEIVVTGRKA